MISNEQLPPRAEATAEFVEIFDNLFDIMNSSYLFSAKKLHRPISLNSHEQMEYLQKAEKYLAGLVPQGRKSELPFLSGWIRNIKSLRLLLNDTELTYIRTRRICQDMIENLFGQIRAKGGNRDTLTVQQFRYIYRSVCVDKLQETIKDSNCQADNIKMALTLNEIIERCTETNQNNTQTQDTYDPLNLLADICARTPPATLVPNTSTHLTHNYSKTTTETQLSESELQCLYYLIGRSVSKALGAVKCSDCSQSLRTATAEISTSSASHVKFCKNKQYQGIKNGLTCPKIHVFEGAHKMEVRFRKIRGIMFYRDNVVSETATQLRKEFLSTAGEFGCTEHTKRVVTIIVRWYTKVRCMKYMNKLNKDIKNAQKKKRQNKKYNKLVKSKLPSATEE